MSDSTRPKWWALIPPPLMFAVPLLIGLVLNSRFPIVQPDVSIPRWVGVGLIALGAAHVLTSVMLFLFNRTTIVPHHHASTFVQRGAYRWTRNPMYVGLTLIYLGICSLTAAAWALLFLPVPLLYINGVVIPIEERHMEEVFGAAYAAYKTRVRRWL